MIFALTFVLLLLLAAAANVDGGVTSCTNGTSTCNIAPGDGVHICCPYVDGTCCSDGHHCCPSSFRCDSDRGLCSQLTANRPWKLPMTPNEIFPLYSMASLQESDDRTMRCDDHASCPGDTTSTTCCSIPFVGHDCCPLGNGVCCNDFLHCCPSGTSCDVSSGECITSVGRRLPFYKKTKAVKSKDGVVIPNNIKCPDNATVCYDSDTCCPTGGGMYGCCPIPNAVCCSDLRNCCPSGMTCDTQTGACVRLNGQRFPGLPLLSSIVKTDQQKQPPDVDLICPGGQYSCPDWMTCCVSGGHGAQQPKYSCCPFSNAVCCSDEKHCCPYGTTCDLTHDVCVSADGDESTSAALFIHKKVANVPADANQVCPDQGTCPDTDTCCPLTASSYGCCKFWHATCCDDHVNCCPYGTTCDLIHFHCVSADESTSAALFIHKKVANVSADENQVCPDQRTCPDTYTCCQLPAGGYGCCPFSQAVCCDDHVHCYPQGTVCDLQARGCRQENDVNVTPFGRLEF